MGWEERAEAIGVDSPSSGGWEARADALDSPEEKKKQQTAAGVENVKKFGKPFTPSTDPLANQLSEERAQFRTKTDPAHLIGQGFVDLKNSAVSANRQAADLLTTDPRKTIGNPQFRNETMRGVNDAVMPFVGNRLVEAIGGPARESPEDKAAFPNARSFGGAVGMAVPVPIGPAVKAVAKGVEKLGAGAAERQIDRAAVALGEGAGKRVRGKLQSKEGQPLRNVLGAEPEMMAAAHESDPVRAKAAETVIAKGQKDLQKIYTEADIAHGRQPVAAETIARAEDLESQAFRKMEEAKQFPEGTEQNLAAKRDAYPLISESQRLRREAAAKISSENVRGIRGNAPIDGWNARIAELRATKLPSDAKVADELTKLRDDYISTVGQDKIIPTAKLRAIQSDYQRVGFKKPSTLDESPRVMAHQEASKIVGEPVIQHVTGMSYADARAAAEADKSSLAAKLFAANEKVEVGNNILAGIEARKGQVPKPEKSLARRAVEKMAHGGAHAGAAILTHGASIPITVGAEALLRSPPYVDSALMKMGKLASKVPDYGVVNPIASVVSGTRRAVNAAEALKSRVPRNRELGAIDIGSLTKDPEIDAAIKERRIVSEAKDRTKDALDKRLPEDERMKAIRDVLRTLGDMGNE